MDKNSFLTDLMTLLQLPTHKILSNKSNKC